jgi:hypothetical protein
MILTMFLINIIRTSTIITEKSITPIDVGTNLLIKNKIGVDI